MGKEVSTPDPNDIHLNGPPILHEHITSIEFKKKHCDFDSIIVNGKPDLLKGMGENTVVIGGTAMRRGNKKQDFVIATYPFIVTCNKSRRDAIIDSISKELRGEPQMPSDDDRYLVRHPITMFAIQFSSVLNRAGVQQIQMRQFGHKGDLERGQNLMKNLREADPQCEILFDLAMVIPPQMFHWATEQMPNGAVHSTQLFQPALHHPDTHT